MNANQISIVAFLQNQWFKDPERAKLAFEKMGTANRHLLVEYALFRGCLTGRRLRAALGSDLCDEITWEETTTEIGGKASSVFPPQPDHIRGVIERHRPVIVLTFGKIARESVGPLWNGTIFSAPHPAARGSDTVRLLAEMARDLKAAIALMP
jgi:hypothetical protein